MAERAGSCPALGDPKKEWGLVLPPAPTFLGANGPKAALSLEGSGRSLSAPVGPLGPRLSLRSAWSPNRTPTETLRLRWTPDPGSLETLLPRSIPSRSKPEGSHRRTIRRKWVRLAPRASSSSHPFRRGLDAPSCEFAPPPRRSWLSGRPRFRRAACPPRNPCLPPSTDSRQLNLQGSPCESCESRG